MNIDWNQVKKKLRKFWKKTKKFLRKLWKKFKKFCRKVKRFLKVYFRQVKRYADDGDYRPVVFTAAVIAMFILLICLIGSWIKPNKKHKTKLNNDIVATSLDANYNPSVDPSYDPILDDYVTVVDYENIYVRLGLICVDAKLRADLAIEAKRLYNENMDLLVLVNEWNPLDENYSFEHVTLNCGLDVDARCYEPLKQMLDDLNAVDLHYGILSAYRSREEQQKNIENDVKSYMASGMTEEEAYAKTYELVAKVGCSEHETGLCLDIAPEGVYMLDDTLAADPVEIWFMENCYRYGFILRYPAGKEGITGINYEPWHYRYVGVPVATFIHDNNLTLEEFIGMATQ